MPTDLDDELGATATLPPPEAAGSVVRPQSKRRASEGVGERPYGGLRELPHSLEAEEHLLSCCFIDGAETMGKCRGEGLTWADFFAIPNQVIFRRLDDMGKRGLPLDLSVLAEESKKAGEMEKIGGYPYLMQVSSKQPTTAQAGYFVERVKNLSTLRKMIAAAGGIVERAFAPEEDVPAFLGEAEAQLQGIFGAARGKAQFTDHPAGVFFEYPKRNGAKLLLGREGALKRGGSMEWVAPTGQGKSSSIIDASMCWSRGKDFMGLIAHAPMKILVMQAEDDEEVLGKICASFCAAHALTEEERALINQNLIVSQVKGVIGRDFIAVVEQKCKLHAPDILIINPVGRYVHGSMSDDTTALEFTAWLDGVNMKLGDRMGIICVAHTGKPPKGEERKAEKALWEMAYMSTGSSAWANYYRATVYLEPRLTPGRYWLVLAKLGYAWGLRDEVITTANGEVQKTYLPRLKVAMKHSTRTIDIDGEGRPMIVWEPDVDEAGEEEPQKDGKMPEKKGGYSAPEVAWYYPASNEDGKQHGEIARAAQEGMGMGPGIFNRWRADMLDEGIIIRAGSGYRRTAAGDDLAARRPGG